MNRALQIRTFGQTPVPTPDADALAGFLIEMPFSFASPRTLQESGGVAPDGRISRLFRLSAQLNGPWIQLNTSKNLTEQLLMSAR